MNQMPPHLMSAPERLTEVAEILAGAMIRLKNKNKNNELREYLAGLQCQAERPCSVGMGDCDDE